MGFSTRGVDEGSGLRTEGLRDREGTINISGREFLVLAWLLFFFFLLVCMNHKIMNCSFSSHTYCTVLLFQKKRKTQNQPEDVDSRCSYQGLATAEMDRFDKLF